MAFSKYNLGQNTLSRPSRMFYQSDAQNMLKEEGNMETINGKLAQICLTNEMADVFFLFQDESVARIPAHKMILALGSPVFKAMFYGSFPLGEDDIRIEDISLDTFQILMKYVYTDQLQLSKDSVVPLLYAAQEYMIAGLISKCENYIQDNLAVHNACTLFSHAKFFTIDDIKTKAHRFIADNAIDVLKNDDFLLLPSENLVDILKFNYLCVQEECVILAVLKWVDHKLTKSKCQIDGKSRRAVLLKDGILYNMAIPLLSIDEYSSIVLPCGFLTEEEELQFFKDKSIPNISSPSSCGKFKIRPREGTRVVEVSVNDILYPGNTYQNRDDYWVPLEDETVSIKTNERIKIKSVTIKPQFKHQNQNNCNFKVKIETQSGSSRVMQKRHRKFSRVDKGSSKTEEGTDIVKVILEGGASKLSIEKVIQTNETLVLTIEPASNRHEIKFLSQNYQNLINGTFYQHEISHQTKLYLSLTGGHLVESFEVIEIC